MTKQARILSPVRIKQAIDAAPNTRCKLILMLSIKAGMRACEIAGLNWDHIDWEGKTFLLSTTKGKKPRNVPISSDLFQLLVDYNGERNHPTEGFVIPAVDSHYNSQGRRVKPNTIAKWIARHYASLEWEGYSSHSGRRTFVTRAARKVSEVGGSLKDVQALVGHASIQTTQGYIDTDEEAQRKLVDII